MKLTEKRMLLYLAGKIILRIRPTVSAKGRFFIIMSFYGAGWTTWSENLNYKTEKDAISAINLAVEMNPSMFIADKDLESLEIKPMSGLNKQNNGTLLAASKKAKATVQNSLV